MAELRQVGRSVAKPRNDVGAVLVLALVFAFVSSLIVLGIVEWSGNDLKNTANFEVDRTALYGAGGATQNAIATTATTPPTTLKTALTAGETGITSIAVTALPTALSAGDVIAIGTTPTTQVQTAITVAAGGASAGSKTISVLSFTSSFDQPIGTLVNLGICPGGDITGSNVSVWCNLVWFPQLSPPNPSVTREVTVSACLSTVSQSTCQGNSSYIKAIAYFDDYNTSNEDRCTSPDNASSCGTGVTIQNWVVRSGQT